MADLSRLVPGHADDCSGVPLGSAGDHQRVIAGLVDQHLVRGVVSHRVTVDVPQHLSRTRFVA